MMSAWIGRNIYGKGFLNAMYGGFYGDYCCVLGAHGSRISQRRLTEMAERFREIVGFWDEFDPGTWRCPKKSKGSAYSRPYH